jgi:uncharacterized RmlC-like cupin family protein
MPLCKPGDFLYVPAWLPHQEINSSKDVPFEWDLVRSTPEAIVLICVTISGKNAL